MCYNLYDLYKKGANMRPVFNYKKVRELMTAQGKEQLDLVYHLTERGVKTSQSGVSSWFRSNDANRTRPKLDALPLIAEFLGVEIDDITENLNLGSPVKAVPIVAEASCGLPISSSYQSVDDFTYIPAELFNPELYALIANGDSMYPEISDGDKVICDPTADIKSGDMVHYILDGDSAIKIYYDNTELNAIELIPYNQSDNFKTLSFRKDDERLKNMQRRKVVLVVRDNLDSPKARLRRINKE